MTNQDQISDVVGRKASKKAKLALGCVVLAVAILVFLDNERLYEWVKAFHVIAIIAWMAGLVYLPRLFVYHTDAQSGSVQSETFKVMERRLLKVIMTPAMLLSWVFGLWLAWAGGHLFEVWFVVKFLGVVALSGTHMFLAKSVRLFAVDGNERSASSWRMINEVPTVLMLLIVVFVIVKPF